MATHAVTYSFLLRGSLLVRISTRAPSPNKQLSAKCEYSSRLRWHLPPCTTPRSRGYSDPMACPSRASASAFASGTFPSPVRANARYGCTFDFDTLIGTFRYPGLAPPLGFSFTVYLLSSGEDPGGQENRGGAMRMLIPCRCSSLSPCTRFAPLTISEPSVGAGSGLPG